MSNAALFAFFLGVLFFYVLLSKKLQGTPVTGPIVFVVAGMVALPLIPGAGSGESARGVFLGGAEVALVMLLFADASRTNQKLLLRAGGLSTRLLTVGLLGTILLGSLAALVVFGRLSIWEAGVLGAILAPTDAGLGQIIVQSPAVPERIREALNTEAGLNDGLSVPFLLFFMALVAPSGGTEAGLLDFIIAQLGFGVLIGLAVGGVGGALLQLARRRRWMAATLDPIAVVVLPLICIVASEEAGASMFIAAFVAGLAAHRTSPDALPHRVEFAEGWGQFLSLAVFFLFGLIVAGASELSDARVWIYAALSLTVVRMLPVFAALAGSGLDRASVLFMGWFGPRGLASIVLGLVYLEHHVEGAGTAIIKAATTATVLASVLAHGLSAAPGIRWLGRREKSLKAEG